MLGVNAVEEKLVRFVATQTRRVGRAPTYAMIARHLGYASKSAIVPIVNALVRRGIIARHPHGYRSLKVIHPDFACPACGRAINSAPAPRADALAVDNAAPSRHDSERQHIAVVR